MHNVMYVTLNKDKASTSKEARDYVSNYLSENGFIGSDGRWSLSLADWFVIGGRWSGELSRRTWAKALFSHIERREKDEQIEVRGVRYGDKADERQQARLREELEAYWQQRCLPEYTDTVVTRDAYKPDGYSDDAMIVTEELLAFLVNEVNTENLSGAEMVCDIEDEELGPAFVGAKWVVVVDYHT